MKPTKEKSREYSQRHYYKDLERSRRLARERAKKSAVKSYYRRLERVYGLTDSAYSTLLYAQGGRCAVCRTQRVGGKAFRFHVDHDHTTGKVRGLLCNNCNALLGYAKDSPVVFHRAALYLRSTPPLDVLDAIVSAL